MNNELRFALYAIKKNIQSSAELRTSFLMNVVGMAINNSSFIILWVFFVESVGVIGGWTAADVVGLEGFAALSYGIVFSMGFGIRKLPDYISSGAFDRFMLAPKNLLMRIVTSAFGVSAVGDVVFGIVCLTIYAFLIQATLAQIALILGAVVLSTIVFLSLSIILFSSSFFFADSTSVTNGLFDLFLTPTLFHGGAFQGALRFVYTFLIPSLLVAALPVEIVKDLSFSKLALVAGLGLFWFFFSLKLFQVVVKKYESSNFMTFGS